MRAFRLAVLVAVILALCVGAWWLLARPRARLWRLPDGTEVYFRSGTRVEPAPGYPNPREIRVNGDVFMRVGTAAGPLEVRSRLMLLRVDSGSELRVTAFARETGEETDLLRGRVVAAKAYPSSDAVPDTLLGGDMVMVNQTIDLMEKERADVPAQRQWSAALVRDAGR